MNLTGVHRAYLRTVRQRPCPIVCIVVQVGTLTVPRRNAACLRTAPDRLVAHHPAQPVQMHGRLMLGLSPGQVIGVNLICCCNAFTQKAIKLLLRYHESHAK